MTTSFNDGVQNAPTDEQLKTIFRLVSLTPMSTGKTDYLFVVLKDVAQQFDVVGKGNANSGTVTALVFGDTDSSPPTRASASTCSSWTEAITTPASPPATSTSARSAKVSAPTST